MARKRVHFLKMTISAIIFQKFARRWLAKRDLLSKRENRAAVKIQNKIRVILAKKILHSLKKE